MSRTTYVMSGGKLVEKRKAVRVAGPMVMSDIPDYQSPIDGSVITSRSRRREDLKRHGCREVDPSEFKVEYNNERFARKRGLPYTPKRED